MDQKKLMALHLDGGNVLSCEWNVTDLAIHGYTECGNQAAGAIVTQTFDVVQDPWSEETGPTSSYEVPRLEFTLVCDEHKPEAFHEMRQQVADDELLVTIDFAAKPLCHSPKEG